MVIDEVEPLLRLAGEEAVVVIHKTGMRRMKDYYIVLDGEIKYLGQSKGYSYEAYLRNNLRVATEYITYFINSTDFTMGDFKKARRKANGS